MDGGRNGSENEAEHTESEELYQTLADNLPDYVIVHRDGIILYVNRRAAEINGLRQEEMVGRSIFDFTAPESRDLICKKMHERSMGAATGRYEINVLLRNGEPRIALVNSTEIPYRGSPAVLVVMTDISSHKNLEASLRESEEKFRSIVENANDIIYSLSPEGRFTYVAPNCRDLLGIAPDEIIGQSFEAVTHPDDAARCHAFLDRALATGKKQGGLEHRVRARDGTWRWFTTNASIIRGPGGAIISFLGIARDITDRKKTEEALRESEEKFRSFVENANDILFSLTPDGITTYVSPRWTELLGHDSTDIVGKPVRHIHPDDFPRVRDFFKETLRTGKKGSGIEYRILHKDGTWQWHTQSISPFHDAEGRIVGIQGICHDITERRNSEEALRESRQLLADAMDIARMANWELDVRTGMFTFDDRFYALYGTTAAREGGSLMSAETYVREFVHPDDREIIFREIVRIMQKADPGGLTQLEHRIVRRDGAVRNIVVRVGVVRDAQGRAVRTFGANQDITDRKNVEKALGRANRQLSLLGSVTRHDIVNKIAAIRGFLSIAQKKFPDPALGELLRKVENNACVIREEIEFTTVYQDLGSHEPQWIELDAVMPRAQVPPAIEFKADVKGIAVFADPMLGKVFFNLLDNAIRHGDRVTEIRVFARIASGNLVIVWEDNGIGVPAGEKEKIFERGFGKHTGFGMFLVREILTLTELAIKETGEPGQGARFEILVPNGTWRVNPGA